MITLEPIIVNGNIIGYKDKLIHIFDMYKNSGKSTLLYSNIYSDWLDNEIVGIPEWCDINTIDVICINVNNNKELSNNIKPLGNVEEFNRSEIYELIGQKINILYVDEWFSLSEQDRIFITNWCIDNKVYLNAYGTSEECKISYWLETNEDPPQAIIDIAKDMYYLDYEESLRLIRRTMLGSKADLNLENALRWVASK